ncbi:uncharacterized protein L3040_005930 [Drepanopeziza brunnea f. sp. 'multigermtubi']|uniref:uncharacterized protein n=1 Tax=Drepanopeziza brunnea f. sp. 'multigermtubi' TaxID=698441 RepID=UPI00238DFA65|nr:hypothetical protein L3040_005930 [Drepanopeziza brunnea f. sp. 'multigermtubi']
MRQGRKAKACDSCARRKRSCDEKQPCSACDSRRAACTYTRSKAVAAESRDGKAEDVECRRQQGVLAPDEVASTPSTLPGLQDALPGPSGQNTTTLNDFHEGITYDAMQMLPMDPNCLDLQQNSWLVTGMSHDSSSSKAENHPEAWSLARPKPKNALPFLRNFASSKGKSTLYAFTYISSDNNECISESTELQNLCDAYIPGDPALLGALFGSRPEALEHISWPVGPLDLGYMDPTSYSSFTSIIPNPSNFTDGFDIADWITDPMFPRSREILMRFQQLRLPEMAPTTPRVTVTKMSPEDRECLRFFSPPNIHRLLASFWKNWSHHCMIIHRPTFDPLTTSVSLLLIMVLLGAAVSPEITDGELAERYFGAGEQIVFQELLKHQNRCMAGISLNKVDKPTALQAALLACCLQHWGGDSEARTRVRRSNFYMLVDSVRSFGFPKLSQEIYNERNLLSDFNWNRYVATEELNRTCMYIFLVDSSFVIFNNSTTKTPLQTFPCRLVSPPACFEAETAEDCYRHLESCRTSNYAHTTLIEAVETFRMNSMTDKAYSMFMGLDSLNLFAILSGVFAFSFSPPHPPKNLMSKGIIKEFTCTDIRPFALALRLGIIVWMFQQHCSLFQVPAYETHIRDVLQKWSQFWSLRSDRPARKCNSNSNNDNDGARPKGFFEHADEYRRFALGLLQLRRDEYRQLRLESAQATIVPLRELDETSMEQVANLLDLMENLEI